MRSSRRTGRAKLDDAMKNNQFYAGAVECGGFRLRACRPASVRATGGSPADARISTAVGLSNWTSCSGRLRCIPTRCWGNCCRRPRCPRKSCWPTVIWPVAATPARLTSNRGTPACRRWPATHPSCNTWTTTWAGPRNWARHFSISRTRSWPPFNGCANPP